MDLKEIRQIIEMMKRHDLSLFHMERDGMKIKLKKGMDYEAFLNSMAHPQHPPVAPVASQPVNAMLPPAAPETSGPDSGAPKGITVDSPMVGTFYRSTAPGETPIVKEGDRIEEGMIVCIIEAMKVMNEIKSEKAGTLVRVLVSDGTPVQYDQPLFELK